MRSYLIKISVFLLLMSSTILLKSQELLSPDTLVYDYVTTITDKNKWDDPTIWYPEKAIFIISEDYSKIIYIDGNFNLLFKLDSPVEYSIIYIDRKPVDIWGGVYVYDFGNTKYNFQIYSDGHLKIISYDGLTYTKLVYSNHKK